MHIPETSNLKQSNLPIVTQEVFDNFALNGYEDRKAVQLLEQNTLAAESLLTYIKGLTHSHDGQIVAYRAAAYLYTMLNEAQSLDSTSEIAQE